MQTRVIHNALQTARRMLHPRDAIGVRMHYALLDAAAIHTKLHFSVWFAALCAIIAAQWAQTPERRIALILWFAAAAVYPFIQARLRYLIQPAKRNAHTVRRTMLRALAIEMPLHGIWIFFVPICWVQGNIENNAFLLICMLGAVTSQVRIYGPCYYLSLPVTIAYLPLFFLYTLKNGTYMDIIMPLMQISYLGLMVTLTAHYFHSFRESFVRLVTIENMAQKLAVTRDEAEQANRAKSAFLAGMSHELRTPLNAIIGFSDLIRQSVAGPVTPPKYKDYADDIYASGQHLLDLINDVLDLSKIEAGRRELAEAPQNVRLLADDAATLVHTLAGQAGVRIVIDVSSDLWLVADERAIRQVLINFLTNAVKFSPRGETVTLFARLTKNGLDLGVTDHGIGMDAEGIRKALEPYGQVHPQMPKEILGTGLGLPIAKALIESHGAAFSIESRAGTGTTVWGRFPASRITAAPA